MKRTVAFCLAILAMVSLLGCAGAPTGAQTPSEPGEGANSATQAPVVQQFEYKEAMGAKNGNVTMGPDSDKKTMLVAQITPVDTLDPFNMTGNAVSVIRPMLYDNLFDASWAQAEEVGSCAKTWTVADDRRTWTVELRDNIYDAEGNNITAYDFEWATGKTSNTYIQSLTALDTYRLELVMTDEYYPGLLTSVSTPAVSRKAYEADPERFRDNPITTGPYKCIEFVAGSTMTFIQTYNYWNKDGEVVDYKRANVDVVRLDAITESAQIQNALTTGELQFATINANVAKQLDGDSKLSISYFPGQNPFVFIYNCYTGSVFADNMALRKAVAYAIDYETMCTAREGGLGKYYGTFGYASLGGYNEAWRDRAYHRDVELAKKYLAEAGYKAGDLTLQYMTNQDDDVAVILQSNLEEIGIKLEIIQKDEPSYKKARKTPQQMEWDLCWSPAAHKGFITVTMNVLCKNNVKLSDGSPAAYSGQYDEALNDLIKKALVSFERADIDAAYDALWDKMWFLPLWESPTIIATYNKIESCVMNYNGVLCPASSNFADDYDVYYKK